MAFSVDIKHQQLINDFERLNSKLDKFINGTKEEMVQLDSGMVKTIAGIESAMQRFKYVQMIIDYKLYDDMVAADLQIEDGMLIRVYGDTDPLKNGIYRKDTTLVYTKINYSEIYDLRDMLPNPWNYAHTTLTPTQFDSAAFQMLSFISPYSMVNVDDYVIEGSVRIKCDQAGYRGSYNYDFKVHILSGNQTVTNNIVVTNESTLTIDTDFNTLLKPDIYVNVVNQGINDSIRLMLNPLRDAQQNTIPSYATITYKGIDTSFYTVNY